VLRFPEREARVLLVVARLLFVVSSDPERVVTDARRSKRVPESERIFPVAVER
jgi:hypothetical protein